MNEGLLAAGAFPHLPVQTLRPDNAEHTDRDDDGDEESDHSQADN